MVDPEVRRSTGVDAILRRLLHSSFGLFPDAISDMVVGACAEHTSARDVQLLLVDLDQEVLTPLGHGSAQSVDWSAAGLAFREEQPVRERTPDGVRLWLPILDSAERIGVLGLLGGAEVPIDDWLALSSALGELIVSKSPYGDAIALARRQRPVSLAAEMRWTLLPPLTFTSPQITVSGILQPSYGVAGDAFDYAVQSDRAMVAVFDAMGHGLQAARLANLATGAFRSGRRSGLDAEAIMLGIDEAIRDEFGEALFVTAQVLTLDLDTGEASLRTAGHPPPVRFADHRPPEIIEVRPSVPLGLGADGYEETTAQLEPGDVLLMVSDGCYEAPSPDRQSTFGWDRLLTVVQDRIDAGDRCPEILRRTMREVLDFQGDAGVRDDTTLALVRWRPEAVGQSSRPTAAELREV